jgi:hypothetical protein
MTTPFILGETIPFKGGFATIDGIGHGPRGLFLLVACPDLFDGVEKMTADSLTHAMYGGDPGDDAPDTTEETHMHGFTVTITTTNSVYRFEISDWQTTVTPEGSKILDRPTPAMLPEGVYGMVRDGDVAMLSRALEGAPLHFKVRTGPPSWDATGWTPVRTSDVLHARLSGPARLLCQPVG